MKVQRVSVILMVIVGFLLAACAPTNTATNEPTGVPAETLTQPSVGEATPCKDVENCTYLIDGQPITLVNGVAEQEATDGSGSNLITSYFGNEVEVDLNADGLMDMAFLLQQENGSSMFFYVAAAIKTADGYVGTNAIFIGDRIAPQSTHIDQNNPSQFVVNYVDRQEGEPMSSPPTEGVSKTFKFETGLLVEVTK